MCLQVHDLSGTEITDDDGWQVTLGLSIAGQLPWVRAAFLIPTQLVASMCAGGLVSVMFPGDISLANSTLSTKTSITQGLFIEMFFTAELVFVVLMLAMEKSRDTFIAPVGIGLALFVTMIPGEFLEGGHFGVGMSLMICRHLLHRGLAEPGAELRLCRGREDIPGLPLDLLAGSGLGRLSGGRLL